MSILNLYSDSFKVIDALRDLTPKVPLLKSRMATFNKFLNRLKRVLEKHKDKNLSVEKEKLLKVNSRLYEFIPILNQLCLNLPQNADEFQKLQEIALVRELAQNFDAAWGRLRRDVQFFDKKEKEKKDKPFAQILSEKKRKNDIIKDTKELSTTLRYLFAAKSIPESDQTEIEKVALELREAIKESETIISDRAKYFGKLDPYIKKLSALSAEQFDDGVLLDKLDQREEAISPDVKLKQRPVKKVLRKRTTESLNDFIIVGNESLGNGSFGEVSKGEYKQLEVALKPIPNSAQLSVRARAELRSEFLKWKSGLFHENICKLHGLMIKDLRKYLVLELCETTLYDLLHSLPRKTAGPGIGSDSKSLDIQVLESRKRNYILIGVAKGLEFLHSRNIIHKNLKPDNILVVNKKPWAKLSSFGFSVLRDQTISSSRFQQHNKRLGGVNPSQDIRRSFRLYKPPEILLDSNAWTPRSDIYSFGIIIWESTQLNAQPFKEFSNIQDAISKGKRPSWEPTALAKQPSLKIVLGKKSEQKDEKTVEERVKELKQVKLDIPEWLVKCAESAWDANVLKRPRAGECVGMLQTGMKFSKEFNRMSARRMDDRKSQARSLGRSRFKSLDRESVNSRKNLFSRTLSRMSRVRRGTTLGRSRKSKKRETLQKDFENRLQEDFEAMSEAPKDEAGGIMNMDKLFEDENKSLEEVISDLEEKRQEESQVSFLLEDLVKASRKAKSGVKGEALKILKDVMERFSENPYIQANGIMSLRFMIRQPGMKKRAAVIGFPKLICEAMEKHPDEILVVLFGSLILGNLAMGNKATRRTLYQAGAVETIFDALNQHQDEAALQRYGIWGLANFFRSAKLAVESDSFGEEKTPESKDIMSDETGFLVMKMDELDIITVIVKRLGGWLSSDEESDAALKVLMLLYNILTATTSGIIEGKIFQDIEDSGLVKTVLDTMYNFRTHGRIQEYGCSIISIVSQTPIIEKQLIKNNAIENILETLTAHPQSSKILNTAWKCIYVLVKDGRALPQVLNSMEKDIRRAPKQIHGCTIIKSIAERVNTVYSYSESDEEESSNPFVKYNVIDFLITKVLKKHDAEESTKQVLLEVLKTIAAILKTQPIIYLDSDLFLYDINNPSRTLPLSEMCLIEESLLHRQFLDLNGTEIVYDTFQRNRNSDVMISACLDVLECITNVGRKEKFDLFLDKKLYHRNALDDHPHLLTEVVISGTKFSDSSGILTKALIIARDLCKWDEMRERKDLISAILFSERVTEDERTMVFNKYNSIQLESLKVKDDYRDLKNEQKNYASQLLSRGIPTLVEATMRQQGSDPAIMLLALQILFHLSKDDWGRAQMSERMIFDMVEAVFESYVEHYPDIIRICCLLYERNILCGNCRRTEEDLNIENSRKIKNGEIRAQERFVWESKAFCNLKFDCQNLNRKRCYENFSPKIVQLIFGAIISHQDVTPMVEAASSCLRSIASLSEEALFHVEDAMNGFKALSFEVSVQDEDNEVRKEVDIYHLVPWVKRSMVPEGGSGRHKYETVKENGPRPANLYHSDDKGNTLVSFVPVFGGFNFNQFGYADVDVDKNMHFANYFAEDLEIMERNAAKSRGDYMPEQLDRYGLEAAREKAKEINVLKRDADV
eukprot:augustus_masked-scaffold_32-processed-gene-0.38-mRNA-1 protein AED:1.00 eAED:1.00 QI:0/-1/0/0/-1/1/1/0/1632